MSLTKETVYKSQVFNLHYSRFNNNVFLVGKVKLKNLYRVYVVSNKLVQNVSCMLEKTSVKRHITSNISFKVCGSLHYITIEEDKDKQYLNIVIRLTNTREGQKLIDNILTTKCKGYIIFKDRAKTEIGSIHILAKDLVFKNIYK